MPITYLVSTKKNCKVDNGDCYEDKLAKVLLEGGKVTITDYDAEDEDDYYGKLPHRWGCGMMQYDLTLMDIEYGIGRAIDSGGWECKIDMHLIHEPEQLDLNEGYSLLQFIVFGEIVYG